MQNPKIVVIGAGVGGLSLAITLKKKLGFENFTIYEKSSSVGGTWRDNKYPGCSSDVPIHFYSLSSDLNPNWSNSHPFQPEIEKYWQGLSNKYALSSHIVFGTKVVSAIWDSSAHKYDITTEDVATGAQSTTTAQILISAVGLLDNPQLPDIKGISDFGGTLFHSSRWIDTEFDGKRVAVVGNGASAAQLLPIISKTPGIKVTQFARTPNWVFPPLRTWFKPWVRWSFKNLPFSLRLYRAYLYLRSEYNYYLLFANPKTRSKITGLITGYIKAVAPAEYHDKLVPDYSLGCKRVLFDTDYLSALNQDNVDMNWDGIESINENGILTKKGDQVDFDVMIFATGFDTNKYSLDIRGTKGQTVQDYYDGEGGPTSYLGTSTPGFPNFCMLAGPNTATGYTSIIFTEEVQVNYIAELIKPVLDGKISSFEVTASATAAYDEKVQGMVKASVWEHCSSWYRVGRTGKVGSIWPGSATEFWWLARRVNWDHFRIMGSKGRFPEDSNLVGAAFSVLLVSLAFYVYRSYTAM